MQGFMQEDIRSLLPEALELIRNKLEVLRASHLDGFERTQLDALQLDVCLPHPGILHCERKCVCWISQSSIFLLH
jgi:hypothetical protein